MPGGRPRKDIDKEQFEKLCEIQCTEAEICDYFDVTDKTLNAWCRRTYKKSFSEVFAQKRNKGKVSLRRTQFQQAQRNYKMAIWLGKQWLGQTDKADVSVQTQEDDPLSKAMEALMSGDMGDMDGED